MERNEEEDIKDKDRHPECGAKVVSEEEIEREERRVQVVVRGIEYIAFHYGANRVEVEDFQREFTSRYNLPSILTQLGPVVGTYSGPDMIGVTISEKKSP